MLNKMKSYIFDQKTILLFIVMCILGTAASGQTLSFIMREVLTRLGRNAFLVLALLIPVQAGIGLNFAIVIGAIAAQIGVFFVVYWGFSGMTGLLLCAAIATPLAILFGYMIGRLFNNMKGSEMIGGLILGFFADGLYQLLFLFIIGGIIPVNNPTLIISSGIGVKNTIDLTGNLKYALDDLLHISVLDGFSILAAVAAVLALYRLIRHHRASFAPRNNSGIGRCYLGLLAVAGVFLLSYLPALERLLMGTQIARIVLLDLFTVLAAAAALYTLYRLVRHFGSRRKGKEAFGLCLQLAVIGVLYAITYVPLFEKLLLGVVFNITLLSVFTLLVLAAGVCVFIKLLGTLDSPGAVKNSVQLAGIAFAYALTFVPWVEKLLLSSSIPVVTYLAIVLLYLFNGRFMKTVLGQNMRTVGQSMSVATASGINVDRTRNIAMILSTMFASWGQLIYLQNMGTFQTYGAHYQVGQYAIAALLVGGASVHKASGKQAIIGVILFHTLFVVSPLAGKNLFGDAGIGEYFRVFVSYGVIAVSLALHAWKRVAKKEGSPLAE